MKPERRALSATIVVASVLALLLAACSGSAPSIDELKWKIILRDDGDDRYEQLMVFARVSDPDSAADPAVATVTVGGTGLFWRFDKDTWSEDIEGNGWWGLPPMAAQGGFRLPDGGYTFRLEDLAGRNSELEFRPDPARPREEDVRWPTVGLESGVLEIDGDYPDALLVLRNSDGTVLESIRAVEGTVVPAVDGGSWEIRIPGTDGGSGFFLGPYLF